MARPPMLWATTTGAFEVAFFEAPYRGINRGHVAVD